MPLTEKDYYSLLLEVEGLSLIERLDLLLKAEGVTKKQFSDGSGIPYPTIMGFYQKGMESIKLSTLQKVCDYFNVPVYFFMAADHYEWGAEIQLNDTFEYLRGDPNALEFISGYRLLPEGHREAIRMLIAVMASDHLSFPSWVNDSGD